MGERTDAEIYADPKFQALIKQFAPYIGMLRLQAPTMIPNLPSVLREPLIKFLEGLNQVEKDLAA